MCELRKILIAIAICAATVSGQDDCASRPFAVRVLDRIFWNSYWGGRVPGASVTVFRQQETSGYCAKQLDVCEVFRFGEPGPGLHLIESRPFAAPQSRGLLESCSIALDPQRVRKPRAIATRTKPDNLAEAVAAIRAQFGKLRGSVLVPYFSQGDGDIFIASRTSAGTRVLTMSYKGPGWWVFHDFRWSGNKLTEREVASRIEEAAMLRIRIPK